MFFPTCTGAHPRAAAQIDSNLCPSIYSFIPLRIFITIAAYRSLRQQPSLPPFEEAAYGRVDLTLPFFSPLNVYFCRFPRVCCCTRYASIRSARSGGSDEGLGFSWFQASTDVSGLALRGAHRWGYVLSHMGGQRLFKDSRQRFFVLLDHYMCYFDSHAPEVGTRATGDHVAQ